MTEEHSSEIDITAAATPQSRNIRIALALAAAGVLLAALVFLAGGGWGQSPPGGVAAREEATPQNTRSLPTQTPIPPTPTIDWSALAYMLAAAQPTSTQTPEPTAAPQPLQPAVPASQPAQAPAAAPVVQQAAQPAAGCPTQGMSGFALDLFNAINNARAQNGMYALPANGCVTYIAQIRSDDMASRSYFAHQSPTGQTAFTLLDSYGVPSGWAGENLARNNYPTDQTVAVAIRDLMNSPSHRDNILNPHYTSMGVAVTLDSTGIYYYTMIFVGA